MARRVTTLVKKTLILNQDYINKAVRFLNARTETDAVNTALKTLVDEEAIINGHQKVRAKGKFTTPLE